MSDVLSALRFVRGSVAKKDFVPVLTCLRFHGGRVTGYNGIVSLSSPVTVPFTASVPGVPIIKAVEACDESVALGFEDGKLSVHCGKFFVFIKCPTEEEAFPNVAPTGSTHAIKGPLLPALRMAERFMGEDATRPWACGVLLRADRIVAYNNVVLFCAGADLNIEGTLLIPSMAVTELLRIGVEPERMLVNDRTVSFMYPEGRWLTTKQLEGVPPNYEAILPTTDAFPAVPEGLFDGLRRVRDFVDENKRVYLCEDYVATTEDAGSDGASAAVEGLPAAGCFNIDFLGLLEGVADCIGFKRAPLLQFTGDCCCGALIGMRAVANPDAK